MSRYNLFGAVYGDVVSMYPGTVLIDYDGGGANGQAVVEAALNRAVMEVASAVTADVFLAMTDVDAEKIKAYATAGQTSFNLGMFPVVAGSVALWIYPSEPPPGTYNGGGNEWSTKPTRGYNEVAVTDYSVTAASGAITYSGATIALGSAVYASYKTDMDAATYSSPMLKQIAILGAAAELGARLFTQNAQEWGLVTEYRNRYNAMILALREGSLIPDEIRRLAYWKEIERSGSSAGGSVRMRRG
jgi:hypothetical protein